ncbi:MAG: hypothetical protein PHH37_13525 [Paludibacter sp.]|nr:hypothetical protein [Paludibacter sp.]
MKLFLKKLFTGIIIFTIIFFSSCKSKVDSNEDTSLIKINNNKFEVSDFDSVTLMTTMKIKTETGFMIVDTAIYSQFTQNSNLELLLPEKIFKGRLTKPDFITDGSILISDENVKLSSPLCINTFKAGEYCGKFVFTNLSKENYLAKNNNIDYCEAVYIYADRPAKISGTNFIYRTELSCNNLYNQHYDIQLKKGWNRLIYKLDYVSPGVYNIEYLSGGYTTGMKWIYISA